MSKGPAPFKLKGHTLPGPFKKKTTTKQKIKAAKKTIEMGVGPSTGFGTLYSRYKGIKQAIRGEGGMYKDVVKADTPKKKSKKG